MVGSKSYFAREKWVNPRTGNEEYALVDRTTCERVPFYTDYLIDLCSKVKPKTVANRANDLSVFLSYIDVCSEYDFTEAGPLKRPMKEILDSYPKFLIEGKDSKSGIARFAAEKLDASKRSVNSCNRMLSSASDFLDSSGEYHQYIEELKGLGLVELDLTMDDFLNTKKQKVNIGSESKAIYRKSFLASCISGGAKYIRKSYYSSFKANNGVSVEKAFPIEKILLTIENAKTHRDKALFAFMAASGARHSESAQLLIEDIDFINESVWILDPGNRLDLYPEGYNSLSDFSFKARAHSDTYLLEPFKTIFFEEVKAYIRFERGNPGHNVLFVSLQSKTFGKPWYACERSNYNLAFKEAASKAGVDDYTIHSLRHLYCVYALNYVLTDAGSYGYSLEVVQRMVGHTSVESTKKYAILDKKIILDKIEKWNASKNFSSYLNDEKVNVFSLSDKV